MRLTEHIRLPAATIRSWEEFQQFRTTSGGLLDERYRREQALGSNKTRIVLEGTCGLCQQVTTFTSCMVGANATPDGRLVPNWREEQICGCGGELNSRQRAMLHMAQPRIGAAGWFKLAFLGEPDAVWRHTRSALTKAVLWTGLGTSADGAWRLPAGDTSVHMVLSADHLQLVPPLPTLLDEVHRVLSPGGTFVFTVPFNALAQATRTDLSLVTSAGRLVPAVTAEAVHQFGWDLLDTVRMAGFTDCAANCYWSEEFGYLGTYNMIFLATR